MIYTVTFNPAIDLIVRPEKLAVGQINRAAEERAYWGGKGINVSGILRQLGHESTALGFAAGFTGKALEEGLRSQGIRTDLIFLPEGMTRINVKIRAQEETDINGPGPAIGEEALSALYARLDALREGDVLVLAGSIPASMPADMYERILSRLSGRGVEFVVDAEGDLLRRVIPFGPFLIKPNHHELGGLFGETVTGQEDIVRLAKRLQQEGARNILVSMGGDGAVLVTEAGEVYSIGTAKGQVVDTVGAGDSMVAGFLAGWIETQDPVYALKLGTAAGGATAFTEGLATGEEIRAVLATL